MAVPTSTVPGGSVEGFASRLRGSETIASMLRDGTNGTVFITCSGYTEAQDVLRYIDAGANWVWGKPIPSLEIVQVHLRFILESHRRALKTEAIAPYAHAIAPVPGLDRGVSRGPTGAPLLPQITYGDSGSGPGMDGSMYEVPAT